MKGLSATSGQKDRATPTPFIRGEQDDIPLNVAIVGGGKACHNLLSVLDSDRLARLKLKILGVSDVNPDAPGFLNAKALNLFTTSNFQDLFTLPDLNLIIELTGSVELREQLFKVKPAHVSIIDYRTARLIWDLIQIETEKTLLEKEHQEYQEKEKKHSQVIMDSLPYRLMVFNMDLTVDTVNKTFLKEFGVTEQEVIGKRCHEIRYRLDESCDKMGRICYIKQYMEDFKSRKIFSTIREYIDEKGEERFDTITIAPIFDEKGEIVQFLEASRDVTERIALEREVQKSKTFFEKVIQSTVDGIVVVDTKGNVLIFNEGMERVTGYSAEEVKHLSRFYPIDTAKENMKKMRSSQYGPLGKLNPTSMTITTKGGEVIPVTLSASIIEIDGKEVGSVGVFTDMREILNMRKELEETHLQLVQSEKIASVGRMAAGVAHEINNPLSGIMIYAELLRDQLTVHSQLFTDVQVIVDQTLRCKKIVSELLEFSRQTVGKVSSFPMEELIDKSLGILVHQAIFQNIGVITYFDADLPEMVGDRGQLQQVLTNLFINAADAMEGKGKLEIRVQYDRQKNLFIIQVHDTGPGIPEHLRDKIFDIFFTTKPVGKGTGLGLSISKKVVELHGGSITVNCPPEGGTTFCLELPLGFIQQPVQEPLFVGLDVQ